MMRPSRGAFSVLRVFFFLLFVLVAHPGFAQSWRSLADSAWQCHARNANFLAVEYASRALALLPLNHTDQDSLAADVLSSIAWYNWCEGRIDAALVAVDRALPVYERVHGPVHSRIADALHRKGTCLWDMARYAEGEECLRKAVMMRTQLHGPEAEPTLRSLVSVAALLQEEGKIAEADQLYSRLLGIWKRKGTPIGPGVANNLGSFYTALGRFALAESLFSKWITVPEQVDGDPFLLTNVGLLYQETGRPEKAQAAFRQSIEAFDAVEGRDNPDNAIRGFFRINLGEFYRKTGMYASAESVLVDAMSILERTGRMNVNNGLLGARSLADLFMDTHQFQKADRWLRYLFEKTTATLGTEHPDMVRNYLSRSRYHSLRQEHDEALRDARLATGLALRVLRRGIVSMTEGEALAFARVLRNSADVLLSDVMALGDSARCHTTPLLDLIVSTKGIVSDAFAMRSRRTPMDSLRASEQASLLHILRSDLARVYVRSARAPAEGDGKRTDSLSRIIDDLESTIARDEGTGSGISPGELVRIADLCAALPPRSAGVEYLQYRSIRSTKFRYAALVFDHSGRTELVDLADADTVENIIAGLRRAVQDAGGSPQDHPWTGAAAYTGLARSLYRNIWSRLEEFLRHAEMVFIAPEGSLNLVAFAGLVDRKGAYVIERHRLHYVSAGRDVLRMVPNSGSSGEGFLALGDPDYDASRVERFAGLTDDDRVQHTSAPGWSGNLRSGFLSPGMPTLRRLPGTRMEVEAIAAAYPDAVVLKGAAASEENLKRIAPLSRRIHIATHGFVANRPLVPSGEYAEWYSIENPLLLSGLYLAGSNLTGVHTDSAQGDDGVLTALEVVGMDLHRTDLVVLSGCETGLGTIEQGEGVFGLGRAFQMAGARTVISSLWEVPDAETVTFMKALYASHAPSYPELLQTVALQRIRESRLRGRPDHPFIWGAFVATGDWRIPPKR